ncbi:MAG TPA: ankyrin repeat domain-containing protein, partial [Tepidisphaeraceae bacterium]|nr:ankyrin repeat domain-containing protein [Tepidisphaeraceae bacterium]
FSDMGMHYYERYKQSLAKGQSQEQAMASTLEVGTKDQLTSESGLLGYWSAGDYSNGDLSSNFLGFVFYRNLTESQMLKGQMRPPMLQHDGPYWKIAPQIRADSDFFALFISNHLDEAYNPGLFLNGVRDSIRQHASDHFEGVLEHRLDRWGNRRSQAWFANETHQLFTYYGTNYGHDGDDKNLVMISDYCFTPPADPKARDKVGRSPLHRAVAWADVKTIEDLISQGAAVNEPVRSDESYDSNWGDTPLIMAVQDGREEIVKLLLSKGANVNRGNDRGTTPLHRAIEYPNIMKILLDAGAKVDAVDVEGRTPLHWAAMGAPNASMSLLIDHGANVAARDNEGQTPLHDAARWNNIENVDMLLSHDADVNARDNFGETPLHLAATCKQTVVVEVLLHHNVDLNAKDVFGYTPMHDAARKGCTPIISLFLGYGGDRSAVDQFGVTPLHLACRNGYTDAAIMLLRAGANPNVKDNNQRSPIDEAKRGGFDELVDELNQKY